jgi:mRNA interferase RelE/StbE
VQRIIFIPSSLKQWTKLERTVRERIRKRLVEFAEAGKGDVKRLSGRPGARLRAGDWRVFFEETDDEVRILAVGHRRDIYD